MRSVEIRDCFARVNSFVICDIRFCCDVIVVRAITRASRSLFIFSDKSTGSGRFLRKFDYWHLKIIQLLSSFNDTLFASDGVSPVLGISAGAVVNNSSVSVDVDGKFVAAAAVATVVFVLVAVAAAAAALALDRYLIAIAFN